MYSFSCLAYIFFCKTTLVMRITTPLEQHGSEIYTRVMFEKFEEVMYEAGRYKLKR